MKYQACMNVAKAIHDGAVGLVSVKPEGYRPLKAVQEQLRAEIVKDKKAEKIMADMKAANATSLDQYKAMSERCQRFFEAGYICCSRLMYLHCVVANRW